MNGEIGFEFADVGLDIGGKKQQCLFLVASATLMFQHECLVSIDEASKTMKILVS